MDIRNYTPVRRLDQPPGGPPTTLAQRREALDAVFRGVELGDYDRELLDWTACMLDEQFDEHANRALVSLIERARNAAVLTSWATARQPPPPAIGRAPVRDEEPIDEPVPDSRLQSLETEAGYGLPGPLHWRYQ